MIERFNSVPEREVHKDDVASEIKRGYDEWNEKSQESALKKLQEQDPEFILPNFDNYKASYDEIRAKFPPAGVGNGEEHDTSNS